MKMYKIWYPSDPGDITEKYDVEGVFEEIGVWTEYELYKLCEEYIKDDVITVETFCDVVDLEEEDVDINDLNIFQYDLDTILKIFDADGYLWEIIEVPGIEPVFRNGKYQVVETIQKEICDESGKPYCFDTRKEAENYVDNLKSLVSKE